MNERENVVYGEELFEGKKPEDVILHTLALSMGIHEAGHLVCFKHFGNRLLNSWTFGGPDDQPIARATSNPRRMSRPNRWAWMFLAEPVSTLAGGVAERVVWRERREIFKHRDEWHGGDFMRLTSPGSRGDRKNAKAFLAAVYGDLGMLFLCYRYAFEIIEANIDLVISIGKVFDERGFARGKWLNKMTAGVSRGSRRTEDALAAYINNTGITPDMAIDRRNAMCENRA